MIRPCTGQAVRVTVLAFIAMSSTAAAQFRLPDNFELAGKYFINGGVARVETRRGRMLLINENREAVRGIRVSRTRIAAPEWRAKGTISEGSIFWDNGSVWCRRPHCLPELAGRYRIRRRGRTRILQAGQALTFINEKGERSGGRFLNATQIVATDWKDIVGTIDGNRITWSNGTTWVGDYPDLSGIYSTERKRRVSVRQRGKSLKFDRGRRSVTAGVILSSRTVRAFGEDRLIGVLFRDGIRWQNGATWTLLR